MAPTFASVPLLALILISQFNPSNAISLEKRAVAVSNTLPTGWSFLGCQTDSVQARVLPLATYADTAAMTEESCMAFCAGKGYILAGVEYGQECWCANFLATTSTSAPLTDCSMPCTGNATEACGAGNRLNVFQLAVTSVPKPPTTNPGVGRWTSLGCYNDSTAARTLDTVGVIPGGPSAMSVALCTASCQNGNFKYSGVEYSGECYCGNALLNGGGPAPDGSAGCTMTCNGNQTELCGGPNRLNMYQIDVPPPTGWQPQGCYTDSIGARTLAVNGIIPGGPSAMANEACYLSCGAAGYIWSGTEYSGECYCGNTLDNGGGPAPDGNALCNMPCNGNATEICGGPNRLTMYKFITPPVSSSSSSSVSPATSSSSVASSSSSAIVTQSSSSSIPASSASITSSSSSKVSSSSSSSNIASLSSSSSVASSTSSIVSSSGISSSSSSVVSSSASNVVSSSSSSSSSVAISSSSASPSSSSSSASSSSATISSSSTTSGSSSSSTISSTVSSSSAISNSTSSSAAISSTLSSSSSSLSSASLSSSSSSTSASASATPTTAYRGCYQDNYNGNGRSLNFGQPDSVNMTVELCTATCTGLGYIVSGLEFTTQCFCDNFIRNGAPIAPDTDCSMPCGGNATEFCGGPNRLSVYSNSNITVIPVPKPQNSSLPGNWTYTGCYTDNGAGGRAFPYQIVSTTNNSANFCLSQCSAFGFAAGGMEYGQECYCGDWPDLAATGQIQAPESDCNTPCTGNASTLCGAGNRLSTYRWTGSNLVTWNYPTGPAAGEYSQFIGGVVIPLITQQAINGKVVFVEKFGTGAPNSTGAYELDPSLVNDVAAAWRPMHVTTDVFCSASVTLPDKGGRIMNVGGWSGVSTYGVRLYYPDGSLGVPGVNDWQENDEILTLQIGRWYPSAMVMTNGSVLVVGGEDGSNGAPVPSLELLPKAGPVMTLDYLQRTDPYNLYPFLCVLPSGGIGIFYYNEGRILDEVTLQTTKILPNTPGAVNRPLGGRTYPLEGTMMLLPQIYPYTDPLTVIVCGGSTPFEGAAIDNCASIQPDAPNPVWTIERMPSKRVMTCMTALPDGTYLILNGGQLGYAGFGLGKNPNLNAVLYDPTKPVNSRMSIMANTTVARMYHSEAILMQDGSVLVSGSDPQDPEFPEEYRVEKFYPPYLLSGITPPTFTITNKDWTYGESISFSLGGAPAGAIRVSLMAVEASTHGNSMGQRTLFPQVSCGGTSCTVTAPPGKYIAPPAWYQMFVLDGPTPSHSVFVRIGGDPGSIGNWPPTGGFNLPGV